MKYYDLVLQEVDTITNGKDLNQPDVDPFGYQFILKFSMSTFYVFSVSNFGHLHL